MLRTILASSFLLLILLLPGAADAAGLVPCGNEDPTTGKVVHCNTCHFVELGNNLVNWLIGIITVLFGVLIVVAGFGLVTSGGNPAALTSAKEKFSNALIGFVIVLAAWLIVDTVMRGLVGETGEIEGGLFWADVECYGETESEGGAAPATEATGTGGATGITGAAGTAGVTVVGTGSASGLSEFAVQQQLAAAGIKTVSTGGCTDSSIRTCTGLSGMQQGTIDTLVAIDNACPSCDIVMTAGTEIGHSNDCHVEGRCADIDCRPNECTASQLQSVKTAGEAAGARVIYETISCSARDAARNAGLEAYCKLDKGYGHITGSHFSIYAIK